MIQGYVAGGSPQREAQRLAGEEMAENLPPGMGPTRWKTIATCAKNWFKYMNAFGGIVGAFFFPEDNVSRDYPVNQQWTHNSFGSHITSAEMTVLLEMIARIFPGIQATFRGTPLEQLVKDIRDERRRPAFENLPWEGGPRGIQHAMPILPDHPIINWKGSNDPNDIARAQPLAVEHQVEELEDFGENNYNQANEEGFGIGVEMEIDFDGHAGDEIVRV